ncbi:MAG: ATP-binding cassette domain-containing protein [Paracoccus sp. (in: a-proteobacteria)]|uniref:ATP-binding cassette domain-containing protein n=1 Tax=Paracoccus sp. TaxID=267 RepID=UPI003919E434
MGENGAGKSTLMKIIAGVCTPDQGEVRFAGKPLNIRTPRDALNSGIAMIHQELNLMNTMAVAENIWIGREPKYGFGLIDHGEMARMTRALFAGLGIAPLAAAAREAGLDRSAA